MDNEKMIPVCCNHFGVGTNNGETFILEFRFQEPPKEPGQEGPITTFSRIAMDSIGIGRLLILLQTSLNQAKRAKGKGDSDQTPPPKKNGI